MPVETSKKSATSSPMNAKSAERLMLRNKRLLIVESPARKKSTQH